MSQIQEASALLAAVPAASSLAQYLAPYYYYYHAAHLALLVLVLQDFVVPTLPTLTCSPHQHRHCPSCLSPTSLQSSSQTGFCQSPPPTHFLSLFRQILLRILSLAQPPKSQLLSNSTCHFHRSRSRSQTTIHHSQSSLNTPSFHQFCLEYEFLPSLHCLIDCSSRRYAHLTSCRNDKTRREISTAAISTTAIFATFLLPPSTCPLSLVSLWTRS